MDVLEHTLEALGVSLTAASLDGVRTHLRLLRRWAPKVNLVSLGDLPHAEVRHAADALSLLRLESVQRATGPVIDVGSGAGFPGIPLAAARPDLDITLLEPRQKRGAFLTQVVSQANLTNARWFNGRLPEPSLHGAYPLVVSRATFPPDVIADRVAPLLAPEGRLIVMSSERIELSSQVEVVERDEFPLGGLVRHLTVATLRA